MVILALLVAGLFLSRRISGPGGGGAPEFDPSEFQDAVTLEAHEAHRFVGERAVVCGTVAATNFASGVGGRPTYLNLGAPFPQQEFDIVIWGRDRHRFQLPPEDFYRGARLCVAGSVIEHDGVPRIEASTPRQIQVLD